MIDPVGMTRQVAAAAPAAEQHQKHQHQQCHYMPCSLHFYKFHKQGYPAAPCMYSRQMHHPRMLLSAPAVVHTMMHAGGFNFIAPAPDQAACGACAAFAAAGLAHAAMAAAKKQSYKAVPALSAQHMYFCAGGHYQAGSSGRRGVRSATNETSKTLNAPAMWWMTAGAGEANNADV